MKKKLLLLMMVMLNSIAAWSTDAYVKVIAPDNSVSWVNIQVEYKMNGNEYRVLKDCIDKNTTGAIDLDNVWSQSGGTGKQYYITEMDASAFYNCKKITSVTCSASGFTTIHDLAFASCSSLVSVSVPHVQEIRNQAFYDCSSLVNVNFTWITSAGKERSTLYKIEDSAFSYCPSLESFYIPEGLRLLGNNVFQKCPKLTSISVSADNQYFVVENCALLNKEKTILYKYLPNLNTTYSIPNTVTTIKGYAFEDCKELETIIIPEGVTCIQGGTFGGCSSLTSINIPDNVSSIEWNAFSGCHVLPAINIPSTVTSIGSYAFSTCYALSSITLPSSVTTIGYDAFNGCDGLASITIYAPSLTKYEATIGKTNTIYVLADKVSSYKSNWSATGYSGVQISNKIKPITMTANDAGASGKWCTYYNEKDNITVSSGTTIYKAKLDEANNKVLLTEVEGDIIKAGEAVVLNSTSGSIELSSAASAGTGDYSDNDLKGGSSVAAGNVPYTLANSTNGLGFYKFDIANYTLDPYKAHLEVASSGARKYYGFRDGDDNTTSIKTPVAVTEQGDAAVYDLTGRRIEGYQLNRGVYVKNGKKFIVK